jgi:putative aldouronate transport system permease protein
MPGIQASVKTSRTKTKASNLWREIVRHKAYFLVFIPVVAYFIIFHYVPMYGVTIAFKNYNMSKGILKSDWADPIWMHFQRVFSSSLFIRALRNTVVISFLKIIVAFPLPIAFAILIDELPGRRFKKTVQTVSYLPYFISWVVLGGIIRTLLSPSIGAVNYIVELLGGTAIHFIGEASMFRKIIFFSYIWQSIGYGSIIYLAAITGIDQELYEAGRIDGANRLQLITRITIPSITPVIIIMFILNLGTIMSAGFDQIFNLYSPVTYETGDIIDTYVYRVGLVDFQYSYSTAVGLFKNVIGLVLAISTNMVVKRIDPDSALF